MVLLLLLQGQALRLLLHRGRGQDLWWSAADHPDRKRLEGEAVVGDLTTTTAAVVGEEQVVYNDDDVGHEEARAVRRGGGGGRASRGFHTQKKRGGR